MTVERIALGRKSFLLGTQPCVEADLRRYSKWFGDSELYPIAGGDLGGDASVDMEDI